MKLSSMPGDNMFNLLRKTEKTIVNVETTLQDDHAHEWIRTDKVLYRFFREVLAMLSKADFQLLNEDKKLTFQFSNGKYASTVADTTNRNYIIIYPEMINLIKSVDNTVALAILFHEFGHIACKHIHRDIPELDKQIEADSFACKYGLKKALISLLRQEHRSFESIARINSALEFQS